MAEATQTEKALVALCGLCGTRVAEAVSVMPDDVDFETNTLAIHGKGDKLRHVPISEAAAVLLRPAVESAREAGTNVVRVRDRAARSMITRLGEKAGLPRRIASHDLRATFATEVYNKTKDLRLVQELMGHASITTTEIYTAVAIKEMREGVELFATQPEKEISNEKTQPDYVPSLAGGDQLGFDLEGVA